MEQRVALTPADTARLAEDDIRVVVEREAGAGAGFRDAEYRASGAVIVDDRADIFRGADVVVWVKPPAFSVAGMPLREGLVLLGFQDPLHRRAEIARLTVRGVKSLAFEDVQRDDASAEIDALSVMSRMAGSIAYGRGRATLAPDLLAHPVRALVLGCGAAGLAALGAAETFGDRKPTAVGNRLAQEAAALRGGAGRFVLNAHGNRRAIRELIAAEPPELVICAAVHRGTRAPVLLDDASLDLLAPGAVVVDLAAKAGGNCSAARADTTVHRKGVTITHRSNYPSDRPDAASRAYSAAVAAMIRRIAEAVPGRG